ncbi:hypothetical protein HDU82_007145 [Entophlyctis luteolus]|nr:hypothetical protein HDU82_007145 [Entophlyctis luteolus]
MNAHLLDQSNTHFLAVDFNHGNLFCIKCRDYVWDIDFDRVFAGEKVRMDALVSKIKDASVKRSKTVEWLPTLEEATKIQKFSAPMKICTGLRGLINMGSTSDVTCLQCRNVTTAKDPILDLSLNIRSGGSTVSKKKGQSGLTPNLSHATLQPDPVGDCTLVECLERNFAAESLTFYQCGNPGCAKGAESVKHVTIKSLPPILSIQLKRFEHSGQGSKIDTHVRVPSELDMTPFTTQSMKARMDVRSQSSDVGVSGSIGSFDNLNDSVPEHKYVLFAVINHQGSLETGHYTAYVKARGDWFLFDDHFISLATQRDVLASKVYMCFYVRENVCFAPSNDPSTESGSMEQELVTNAFLVRSQYRHSSVYDPTPTIYTNTETLQTPFQNPNASLSSLYLSTHDGIVYFDLLGVCPWSFRDGVLDILRKNLTKLNDIRPCEVCQIILTLTYNKKFLPPSVEYKWQVFELQGASFRRRYMVLRYHFFVILLKLDVFFSANILAILLAAAYYAQAAEQDQITALSSQYHFYSPTVLAYLIPASMIPNAKFVVSYTVLMIPSTAISVICSCMYYGVGLYGVRKTNVVVSVIFLVLTVLNFGGVLYSMTLVFSEKDFAIARDEAMLFSFLDIATFVTTIFCMKDYKSGLRTMPLSATMSNPFTIESEDSDPFADNHTQWGAPHVSQAQPAHGISRKQPSAQPYSNDSAQAQTLAAREAELAKREAQLNKREEQLVQKEAQLEHIHAPNFPPCKPLVYHDIEAEIPAEGKWLVKRLYYAWIFSVFNYLVNAVTCFLLLISKAESAGANFGASLVMLLAITPVSFVFWYQPLYNGVKRNRSIQFFLFQFNYGFHLGLAGLLAAGIPGWGGAGIIYCISEIGSDVGLGIMCSLCSAGYIWQVVYGLWQVKAVRGYYQSRGMNAEEAKQQAITGVAQSSIGREIVKTAVKSSLP